MPGTVIELREDQCTAAGDVVASAFLDNPIFRAIFPNRRRRHLLLPLGCRCGLAHGVYSGQVVEATPSLTAVSLWSPPGYRDSVSSWVRALPYVGSFLRRLTPVDARRFLSWMTGWQKKRDELLPEPHWYLEMLCVDPQWQRAGLGAVLALHGLERAAAEGVPAFLETATPRNVRFYTKLGFEVVEAGEDRVLHIPIWRMLRQPPDASLTSGLRRSAATASST